MTEQPVDDKAHIRHHLDVTRAEWKRAEPDGVTIENCVEYAFVEHADGVVYTAIRSSAEPDGTILIYTPPEWDAFVAGVRDGEFELPGNFVPARS